MAKTISELRAIVVQRAYLEWSRALPQLHADAASIVSDIYSPDEIGAMPPYDYMMEVTAAAIEIARNQPGTVEHEYARRFMRI